MTLPVAYIDSVDRAAALLKPLRTEILRRLVDPATCAEVAEALGETPQKIHYHVKVLADAGLVVRAGERQVRGFVETSWQAAARAYWLAPDLVQGVGGRRAARDQASLTALAGHAEEMLEDVGHLMQGLEGGAETPSLSLAAEIELGDPERRQAFLTEVSTAFQAIAEKYGARGPVATSERPFRLTLACYPRGGRGSDGQ